jgi:rRNA maturation RNase YbeY
VACPGEIVLLNPNRYSEVSARRLRPWLERVLRELLRERPAAAPGPAGAGGADGGALGARDALSMGVRFAGDRAMRRANREFRGKDQTTDVLSFPGDGAHLGDVLVSVPQARRQAAAAGRDPAREIQVLLLHGVLHCLGHDHEVDGGEMERLERRLRRRWIGALPPGRTVRRTVRRAR